MIFRKMGRQSYPRGAMVDIVYPAALVTLKERLKNLAV